MFLDVQIAKLFLLILVVVSKHSCGPDFSPRARFRHVESPGQPLCGVPQHFMEILFKVKGILLSAKCKYVIIS